MSDSVGIKATFSVGGQAVHTFESSGRESSEQKRPSQPPPGGVEGSDKYDHRYTGRHDHGTLPALKSGGPHGELIKALLEAKEDSDAFLTGLINQELAGEPDASKGAPAKVQQEQGSTLGGGTNDKTGGTPTEAMELCDAAGGGDSPHEREALPTAPPNTQPAKRPRS